MNTCRIFFAFLFLLLLALPFAAQSHTAHDPAKAGAVDLGVIEFPNSGSSDAQKAFISGVLLLHSFEYDAARKSFIEAQQIDKDFALAYWGEAMTYDHPIWPENDRTSALTALAKLAPTSTARREKANTAREKMYFDAVERLYGDGDATARAAAYSSAMEELSRAFPDDLEAKAFYSLSILGLTRITRNTENYMRAAAVAEAIYQKNPLHPGALHYLIHAYDDPVHAPLGLRAARVYGTVARSASHAQHMPSHIFFALGMWDDAIRANTDSMKTARDSGGGGYHALHWLQHAYLQFGKIDDAMRTLAIIEDDNKRISTGYARTHLAMCRATMLVETQRAEPASLLEPVDPTGINSIAPFSNHDLAIGLEYVRRKELTAARAALARLRGRAEKGRSKTTVASGSVDRYSEVPKADLDAASVMASILDAAIDEASGDPAAGMKKIVTAAEAEDRLVFEYGPPAIAKPAWEAAGEMYLRSGRKAEAADAFRRALKRYPNRRLSNEGLKQAAK
jgi:tetratricopeptide (TPR) repeat protein